MTADGNEEVRWSEISLERSGREAAKSWIQRWRRVRKRRRSDDRWEANGGRRMSEDMIQGRRTRE
jgi:hypothetical protein